MTEQSMLALTAPAVRLVVVCARINFDREGSWSVYSEVLPVLALQARGFHDDLDHDLIILDSEAGVCSLGFARQYVWGGSFPSRSETVVASWPSDQDAVQLVPVVDRLRESVRAAFVNRGSQ
jgi:hypothetical protein